MTGFTSLSVVVGSSIISEWIKLKDLYKLDSAYCNHSTRSAFLSYCQTGTLSTDFINLQSSEQIQWFVSRKLKFTKLAITEVVWQEGIDISLGELLDSVGSHVKEIKISIYKSPLSSIQTLCLHTIIGQKCVNIQKAQIAGRLTDIEVATLLCGWKSIQELDISCFQITSGIFYIMVNICKRLQCLALFCIYDICDAGLTALAGKCPELEELHIMNCETVTGNGLTALIKTTPKLARLCVQIHTLTDSDACHFQNLQELRIYFCPTLTNTMVTTIVQNNPCLEQLSLSYCTQLTATVILTIVQSCPQLILLNVSNISTPSERHTDLCNVVSTLVEGLYPNITSVHIDIK